VGGWLLGGWNLVRLPVGWCLELVKPATAKTTTLMRQPPGPWLPWLRLASQLWGRQLW
jgi:hypothetical protein